MLRPCFLVVDWEFRGSISTCKLVIETVKFNVWTAYTGVEALQVFERFPGVSGVVLDAGLEDITCRAVAQTTKASQPSMPGGRHRRARHEDCPEVDFLLKSFEPAKLFETLKGLQRRRRSKLKRGMSN
jgi:DNA-binding response OmpR family regulator